jgi:hypothetical protein
MMSANDNIPSGFSAEIIQQYLEGKLSDAEMHAIEKAALEDPFLADAIEGIQISQEQSGAGSFNADVRELHQKLREKVSKRERKRLIPMLGSWQAAAVVFLLVGSVFLTYTFVLNQKNGPQPIAAKNLDAKEDTNQLKTIPGSIDLKKDSGRDIVIEPPSQDAKPAPLAIASEKEEDRKAGGNKNSKKNNESGEYPKEKAAFAKQERSTQDANPVIDQHKKPVESIILNDSIKGYESSIASASVPSTAKPADKLAERKAYYSANAKSKPASLDEAVVAGYSTRAKSDSDDDEMEDTMGLKKGDKVRIEKVIPAQGWKSYDAYLSANKKIITADSTLKGLEIISFMVDNKGVFSNFHIEKSLSAAHDAEAIRLVRAGPPWKLLKGKKERATVVISF